MRLRLVAAALLVSSSCSRKPEGEALPTVPIRIPEAPIQKKSDAEPESPKPATAGLESSIGDLPDGLRRLVAEALDGRILPDPPLALESAANPQRLVKWLKSNGIGPGPKWKAPAASDVDFRIFAIEIRVIFAPKGPAPSAEFEPGTGPAYDAFVIRGPAGIQLGTLRGGRAASIVSETPHSATITSLGREIHARLCDGTLSDVIVGENARSVFGNDAVFDKVIARRTSPKELKEVEAEYCDERVLGFSVGDALLVGNTKDGETLAFELDLHVTGGHPVVRTRDYLVKVRTL